MDMVEFSNQISPTELALIFKNYFEQHIVAFNILKSIDFVKINDVSCNKSSIMYSVKLLDNENKEQLLNNLKHLELVIYGRLYKPHIYLNGDLLCITINK